MAYYSSHGDISDLISSQTSLPDVTMVLILIHGAARNADDYFCTGTAMVKHLPNHENPSSVWVIAPRFLAWNDTDQELDDGGTTFGWTDKNEWRYGADAVNTSFSVSSYFMLDHMLTMLVSKTGISFFGESSSSSSRSSSTALLPNLNHVSIIGHSAGGQFVQRWALLTPVWEYSMFRAVVANPSSFCFFTPLRYLSNRSWDIPPPFFCPDYNKWEWGFEVGGNYSVPYVTKMIETVGSTDFLIQRFATRQVVYLAGSQDRCNVSEYEENGWCYSHGLETSCMDQLEGHTRWERHFNYLASLDRLDVPYHRFTIPNVGHDHSLMFNSENGMHAIFGQL